MQQSHSAISNQQYTFHYAEGQPDTLVMLKSVNKIPQLIYQQIYTIKYVWIDNHGTFFDQDLYKKIEEQVGDALTRKSSFEQLKKDIQNSPAKNYHVLIWQYRQDQFQHGSDQQITDKFNLRISQVYYITNDLSNQQQSNKIFFDQNKLLSSIKKRAQKDSREKFGNGFLVITAQDQKQSPQIGQSTTLAKTFKAIFKQNIGQKVQWQLSQKTKQLFQQLERVNEYFKNRSGREQEQQFFVDLKKGLSNLQAIHWYTDETNIYKTINKLMRAMRDSTQVFYLQPFVKPLYMAIKNKHENEWYQRGKFVCYRGGHISEFEFKRFKKGEIIQNLNFMSTSISHGFVEAFIINAYFIIEVEEAEQQKQENQGFGYLQEQTKKKGESQILFNPLNSFQVVDEPKKVENYFQIKLRYGPLAKALVRSKTNNKQGKINRDMPNLEGLAKHQKSKTSVIRIQGDALVDIAGSSIEKGAINYWIKYEQILNKTDKSNPNKENEQAVLLKKVDLMNKIGYIYKLGSKFGQAEQYYKQGLIIIQSKQRQEGKNQSRNKNHQQDKIIQEKQFTESITNLLNNLASLYESKGDLVKALMYYEKCQKIKKQKLGEDNIEIATTLNNLGALYQSKGDLVKALMYYEKCQKIRKQKLGEDNIEYATTLNNLGALYQSKGDLVKALMYYEKCQKIRKQKLGEDNIEYATTLNNLGALYKSKGDLVKALMHYEKCQKIQKQKLGEDNIEYARTLNNLGALYQSKGDLVKALMHYEKCQKIQKQKLGEDNIEIATTLNNLGLLYQSKGDLVKALMHYEKCQKIQKQKLGEDNIEYARTLNNLGLLYQSKGDLVKALMYYEKCQKIRKQKLGEDNIEYATTLNNLGLLYQSKGDLVKALMHYEKCQKIQKQKLGEDNIVYATTLNNLGALYQSKGDLVKALMHYEKCQKIQKQKLGEDNIEIATTLNNLGLLYQSKGDLVKALMYYEKCQKIRKQKLGEDNIEYARTLNNLGALYQSKGDLVKALMYYEKCQKIRKQKLGEDNITYADTAGNLSLLYLNKRDNTKCLQWLRKVQKIFNNLKKDGKYFNKQHQKKYLLLINLIQNNKQNQLNRIINILKGNQCNTVASEEQEKLWLDKSILECCTQFLKLHHQIGLNLQRLLKSLPEQLKSSSFIKQELVEACRKMILELNEKQCFVEANEVYKFAQSLGFGFKLLKQKKKIKLLKKLEKSRLEDFLMTEMFISKSWRTQPKQKLEENSVKRIGRNCRAFILMKCMQVNQLKRMGHYEEAENMLREIMTAIESGQISEEALGLLWDEVEEM